MALKSIFKRSPFLSPHNFEHCKDLLMKLSFIVMPTKKQTFKKYCFQDS